MVCKDGNNRLDNLIEAIGHKIEKDKSEMEGFILRTSRDQGEDLESQIPTERNEINDII